MLRVLVRIALESPRRGDSNEYPQHMFLWRIEENYPSIIIKYPPYLAFCQYLGDTFSFLSSSSSSLIEPKDCSISLLAVDSSDSLDWSSSSVWSARRFWAWRLSRASEATARLSWVARSWVWVCNIHKVK